MCLQNAVLDRVLASDTGGGPGIPGTDRNTAEDAIWRLSDDELKAVTRDAVKVQRQADAIIGLLAAELVRRNLCEGDDRLTTTQWLRHNTRMTLSEASGTLKTGLAMAHMPTITPRALEGEIPARSLQLLAQARDKHGEAFSVHEPVFADVATYLDVKDMRRAINHWEQQIDFPSAIEQARHAEQHRSVYLSQMIGGAGDLNGTLTAEGYLTVKTALDAHADPGNLDPDDTRTPAQRRADAIVDIHRFWLDHNTTAVTSGREKPHITVTLDYRQLTDELRRLPELAGTPITPETARRLTCDAAIVPMVLGADSEPLDIGRRTRTIPPSIRRAIENRDKSCTWRGCDAPSSWCDVHHDTHWAHGGETSLTNCRLLCRKHHTATHQPAEP